MTARKSSGDRKMTVLVVDDEKDIADSAREVLEAMVPNCHVETADSCANGIATMMRQPIDAVLVDYRMPEHTGLDFIREARGLEPSVPAILMTAYANMDLASQAINAVHVDGFLAKPIDAATLAHAIESALQRAAGPVPTPDDMPLRW